ncbi:hypothetical protein E4U21_003366 [Claviceps maximensis]|nr:hypothetical protein E4U21_003366 [Claviceps maximensis]
MDSSSSFGVSGKVSPMYGRSRTQSISSDRPSTIGSGFVLPPLAVSPESCFIAPGAASQIITNDHDSHADTWYDRNGIEPPVETAVISGPALQLVNSFLDQLLFNFLQLAKSTRLSSLRLAITEILKPKLAQDAISNAEEELKDYLGGANEDDYVPLQDQGAARNWDLELAWKRIRLRCMVYSSLGDMEEEDEDMYMEEENLEFGTNEHVSDVVSPAVAIFLTSVLEYMGELTLTVAGQAACQRVQNKIIQELKEGSRDAFRPADRIVVADSDMERVALDRTLGRLWRGWKKRVRAPANDAAAAGRLFSRHSLLLSEDESEALGPRNATAFQTSVTRDHDGGDSRQSPQSLEPPSSSIVEKQVDATEIPLPTTDNDVNEIDVPGLAHHSDDETDGDLVTEEATLKRPRSCLQLRSALLANDLTPLTAAERSQCRLRDSSSSTLRRSLSVPIRPAASFYSRVRQHSRAPASGPDREDSPPHVAIASDKTCEAGAKAKMEPKAPNEVIAPAAAQDSPQSEGFDYEDATYEDAAEEFAFQKAEIVTSSRVSKSISTYTASSYTVSSDSDSNNSPYKKRSSIYSARLIDVPKSSGSKSNNSPLPGSPAHSRPVSTFMDKSGHQFRADRGGGMPAGVIPVTPSRAAVSDERWKSSAGHNAADQSARKGPVTETLAGSETWPLQKNASSISEETERISIPTQRPTRVSHRDQPSADAAVTPLTAHGRTASSPQAGKKGPPVKISIKTPHATSLHQQDHQAPTTNAKAAILPAPTPANRVIDGEPVAGLRRKAVSSHAAAKQTLKTIERTRTNNREADEVSLPMQGTTTSAVRQINTAASSVSSSNSRLKPVRTSEDGSSRSESVARNFEELIQSNETITYTLTPETMRDVDSKSPVVTKLANKKAEDIRTINLSKSSLLSVQSGSGLGSSKLPSPLLPSGSSSPRAAESSKHSGPFSRTPAGLTLSNGRGFSTPPREPRVQTDGPMSDFVGFIKSTGPTDENKVYISPKLASPAPVSPGGLSVRNSRRASTASIISRLRYQPRDATVDGKADNSDLIDFIRQGPPIASTNHRIPRHVAPFRTTMDSDELSGVGGGRAVDASIPDIRDSLCSINVTESIPSMHSSINSKSALLKNKGASTMASNMYGGPGGGVGGGDDDMMPRRKTRRVRDPYAIDLSDEDEEYEEEDGPGGGPGEGYAREEDIYRVQQTTAKPAVKREESLADFLRNYDPPPEPVSSLPRIPKKKASAPSLMAIFSRSGGKDKDKDKDKVQAPTRGGQGQGASTRGGYVPIKVSMPTGYDTFGSVDNKNNYYSNGDNSARSPAVSRNRGTSLSSHPTRTIPMKKYEPREAVASKTETADLAAFLRDSAPPRDHSSMGGADRAPLGLDDESGGGGGSGTGKRFGRRKKSLAVLT